MVETQALESGDNESDESNSDDDIILNSVGGEESDAGETKESGNDEGKCSFSVKYMVRTYHNIKKQNLKRIARY